MSAATVLLVEDDSQILASLQRILSRHGGFRVETASDGAEAVIRAEATPPDLIVSDYDMPGMNGFELCRYVKAHPLLRDAMFVVLTGFADVKLKVSGLDLGVDDYLTKPVEGPEFLAKIRATLRIKRLHDELRSDREELERLHHQLGSSFDNLLSILVHVLDLRVPGASSRAEVVKTAARSLAEQMSVPRQYLYDLELACRLHEIGKLALATTSEPPDGDGQERWRYLVMSRAILEQVDNFEGAAAVVASIGENWDGTGVPGHHLQGQIPLRSRILRVLIDFFAQNPGHEAAGPAPTHAALEYLRRFAGTRYDPLVITQLEHLIAGSDERQWKAVKQHIPLGSLSEGMVLADDLVTSSGVKLLAQGTTITDTSLDLILRRHTSDPVLYGAWVEA